MKKQNRMNNSKACECIQSKCKKREKLPSVILGLLRLSRWYFSLVDSAVRHGRASGLFVHWRQQSVMHIHCTSVHVCCTFQWPLWSSLQTVPCSSMDADKRSWYKHLAHLCDFSFESDPYSKVCEVHARNFGECEGVSTSISITDHLNLKISRT